MHTHGAVAYWELYTQYTPTHDRTRRLRSWDEATEEFRRAVKCKPLSATVYAVLQKSGRKIKTWNYVEDSQ